MCSPKLYPFKHFMVFHKNVDENLDTIKRLGVKDDTYIYKYNKTLANSNYR